MEIQNAVFQQAVAFPFATASQCLHFSFVQLHQMTCCILIYSILAFAAVGENYWNLFLGPWVGVFCAWADQHPSIELTLSQWDRNTWGAFLSVLPNPPVRSFALLSDKHRKDKGRPCTAAPQGECLQDVTGGCDGGAASIPKMAGFWYWRKRGLCCVPKSLWGSVVSSAASLLEENPNEIQFFFMPCRTCRVEACEVCITGDVYHTNIMAVHQDNLNKASEQVNFKQNESKMTKGLRSLMNPWLYELLAVFQ